MLYETKVDLAFKIMFSLLFVLCIIGIMSIGEHMERRRIHENCMTINGEMKHSEASAKCGELVK